MSFLGATVRVEAVLKVAGVQSALTVTGAAEAAQLIPDGATVAVCGCLSMLEPETVLRGIEERFLRVRLRASECVCESRNECDKYQKHK